MKIILFFITTAASMALATFSQAQTLPAYLPSDGLVGWWPFNGNANDESGNGNHGAVNGATITTDRLSNSNAAYDFDGINDFILVTNSSELNFSQGSISFWIWTNSNSLMQPLKKGNFEDAAGEQFAFRINNGDNHFAVKQSSNCQAGIGWIHANESSILNNNIWLNIVGTIESSSLKFYVNGQLLSQNSLNQNGSDSCTGDINIGRNWLQDPQWFHGKIDDIGIWNRALTPQEITALYTGIPSNNNGGGGNNNTSSTNVPQGISYQAVARNAQGQPLSNTALQVKFTSLADSLTGTAEYSELHSLTTNDLGLFTTAFGTGTPLSGTFANINWAAGNKYLKVELDAGSGFVALGTQQLLSVPYSMRSNTAAKAGTIENALLPVYSDNAAALAGGLVAGQMYRTGAGVLMVVY